MQGQLINHCKKLSNFSKNPQINNIETIMKSLLVLCGNKTLTKVSFEGYIKCIFCQKSGGDRQSLYCQHVVHKVCLENRAKMLSDGTFDPNILLKLICRSCNKIISHEEYTKIIGNERIMAYQNQANKKLEQELRKIDLQERKQQLARLQIQCPLCLQRYPASQMITMTCTHDHRFCSDCAKGMITQQMKDGKYQMNSIVCKAEGCSEPLDDLLIRNCISKEDFQKYTNLQYKNLKIQGMEIRQCAGYTYKDGKSLVQFKVENTQKEYAATQEELQRKCKAIDSGLFDGAKLTGEVKKCEARISFDPKRDRQDGFIRCPDCLLQSCIKGCASVHRGNTCQKYKQWQAVNQQSKKLPLQQIKKLGMAQCQNPTCMMPILKNRGCDHVTCKCGFQICYRCSTPWKTCGGRCPKR